MARQGLSTATAVSSGLSSACSLPNSNSYLSTAHASALPYRREPLPSQSHHADPLVTICHSPTVPYRLHPRA